MAAAFDLPLDALDRTRERLRGAFLAGPAEVLSATSVADVRAVVDAAEAAARRGRWVVGGLTYEAGSAWDAAHLTNPADGELARFEVYDQEPVAWPDAPPVPVPDWFVSGGFTAGTPAEAVASATGSIAAGDFYQVNLTTRLSAPATADLWGTFTRLVAGQPHGYAVFLRGAGVASASPELFFHALPDGTLVTQPMKGTAPAASSPRELLDDPKQRAENLMIVDLLRNDLGRVCEPGTVTVEALLEVLRLPTVLQLVSTISGRRRAGATLSDVLGALFPCGSVTGAPKIRAMRAIRDAERGPRGWYCGALGVIRPGGEAIFNVPIRTVEQRGDWLTCGVGSGIVVDSEPAGELAEWQVKARFLGGEPFGALETLLLADGEYPRLAGHLTRLARTDAALGLGISLADVEARLAGAAAVHPTGRHRVRLVARAAEVAVSVAPAPATESPVRLALAALPLDVAALRQVVVHKTTWRKHYDDLRALAPRGSFDVVCHTPEGLVTEATTGNLAFRLEGRWVTPAASAGLLEGVERATLLEDGTLVEADVLVTDLQRVTEVAFLNGLRGWCPAVLD